MDKHLIAIKKIRKKAVNKACLPIYSGSIQSKKKLKKQKAKQPILLLKTSITNKQGMQSIMLWNKPLKTKNFKNKAKKLFRLEPVQQFSINLESARRLATPWEREQDGCSVKTRLKTS